MARWMEIATLDLPELTIDQMSEIITTLSNAMHAGEWETINKSLSGDVSFLSLDGMTAVARTVYAGKEHLPAFNDFLERCRQSCRDRNEPTLLSGLI